MATIIKTPIAPNERGEPGKKPPRPALDQPSAESAECNCPDFCERDHERD
jgi:hypothetical protein